MKVLCILYDDPTNGMPTSYPMEDLPVIDKYPDGMTLPSPKGRDFTPGELLGCVSGELGLRKFLEDRGHTLVVTSDKDGEGCEADRELVDSDITTILALLCNKRINGICTKLKNGNYCRYWFRPCRFTSGNGP